MAGYAVSKNQAEMCFFKRKNDSERSHFSGTFLKMFFASLEKTNLIFQWGQGA